jgi:hypothetical protein
MSERDDRYAGNDLPSTTGEFRAAPDPSASTAQFKAFAAGVEDRATASWPEQPWSGQAPGRRASGRTAALALGVIAAIAVIVVVVLLVG